jgi:preprotein translocase subunit SecA/nephrocystin-3
MNPRLQTKSFANVTSISYFQNEDEVLIMLGALFRIESVIEDKKDRVWVIHVSLASEDDYHLKETFAHMKKTIGDDTDLDSLGNILHEMGEYEQAQKCYERMLHDLQVSTANCYVGLGKSMDWQKKCQPALSHYEQAIKIRRKILGSQHESVGEVYNYIGGVQWQLLKDYDQALINLKKAIEIQEKTLSIDSLALARTYNNLAITYYYMNKYDLASDYYNKSLKIEETVLPPEHPSIAFTYNNLGMMYNDMKDYSEALIYFQKSLEIMRKTLPPAHPEIVRTKDNIRNLKYKMKN